MGLLWPSRIEPHPDGIQRFGRVLHWAGTLIGVGLLVGGFVAETTSPEYGGSAIGFFAALAALFLIGGRAFRYMLAGE